MSNNFWTEENKIMNYDSLIRADMRNKVVKMEGQIIEGRELADICYNYDYLISSRQKALKFISDYAGDFVKTLKQYKDSTGTVFSAASDPRKMVSLMALLKGRDIVKTCAFIESHWNEKFTLDQDSLEKILKELEELELPEEKLMEDTVFITGETLSQACTTHICISFEDAYENQFSKEDLIRSLKDPYLPDKTIHSILLRNYTEIIKIAQEIEDVCLDDLGAFMSDVVSHKTQMIVEHGLGLKYEDLELNKEIVEVVSNLSKENNHTEVEFEPFWEAEIGSRTLLKTKTLEK